MSVKCKVCYENFTDVDKMLLHFLDTHLSKLQNIPCLWCDKTFPVFEDLMHHVWLDHQGIKQEQLESATAARATKKQLGDYLDVTKKDVGLECPVCFEMFSKIDQLQKHSIKEHNRILLPEFLAKMKDKMESLDHGESPICELCHKKYVGVIFTKINNKITNVCFNCYEDYFGANALQQLTIGSNEDMIKKMRTPL